MKKLAVHYIVLRREQNVIIKNRNEMHGSIRIDKNTVIDYFFKILDKIGAINKVSNKILSVCSGEIIFKGNRYEYYFNSYSKTKMIYFYITIEKRASKVVIEQLEELCNIIENELKSKCIILKTNDSISEYYCNMLYNKINKFDRLLRQLLYNIYIRFFGKNYINYINDSLTNERIERINSKIKSKGNQEKKLIQFLYNLDYSDLEEILFKPMWTDEEEKNQRKLITNISNLDNYEIKDIVYSLKPKSDWERLFQQKCKIDMNIKIKELRKYRNIVAHSKLMNKEQYNICNNLISNMNKKVESAINETLSEEFYYKNVEILFQGLKEVIEKISDYIPYNKIKTAKQEIVNHPNYIANLKDAMKDNGIDISSINNVKRILNNDIEDME